MAVIEDARKEGTLPVALHWKVYARIRQLVRESWPVGMMSLLALPALWPFYVQGLTFSVDGMQHMLRLGLLDHHIRSGVIYPRWLPELVLGFGYPLYFYAPSTYYLAEVFHLFGMGYVQALIGTVVLLLLCAGVGMYLLALDILQGPRAGRQWMALVAATAYMYAPYLLTNAFVRGALAELGGQALLPWVFWSFRRLMKVERRGVYILPAALSLGGLAITHNITLLLVVPVLVVYLVAQWWQSGRQRAALIWMVAAGSAAIGLSTFFWIPVIVERQYLADTAYRLSAMYISEHVWNWHNFLDTSFTYNYLYITPFRLGLVQLVLGSTGFFLARRRDVEWLVLAAVSLLAGLAIGEMTLPLWLSSDILLTVLFPWRLLTIISLPVALFTAGNLTPLLRGRWIIAGACVLLTLIIASGRPRVEQLPPMGQNNQLVTLPGTAQFEMQTGLVGLSSSQEFMPRWTSEATRIIGGTVARLADSDLDLGVHLADQPLDVTMQAAAPYTLIMTVSATTTTPLRFATFYFPGWEAILEDGQRLVPYPSTDLGLLTVDVPAGTHELRVEWRGTALQEWSALVSLATLALLAIHAGLQRQRRWVAGVPALLLLCGAAALFKPLPLATKLQPLRQPVKAAGVELLGYRLEQPDPSSVVLYPYWYIRSTPPDLRVHWTLIDSQGAVVSETTARPFFNTLRSNHNWYAGTIVDDAYQLALPPGLPAGAYQLGVQLETAHPTGLASNTALFPMVVIGELVTMASVPEQSEPSMEPTDLRFGNEIALVGFGLEMNGNVVNDQVPTVHPGDVLRYTLYWRAVGGVGENYHGYISLLDPQQRLLAHDDHLPGAFLRVPLLWNSVYLQADVYELRIPDGAKSNLYWPKVGLYRALEVGLPQLPVYSADGTRLGDGAYLPPVRIVNEQLPIASPSPDVQANFAHTIGLIGYQVQPTEAGPGQKVRLALQWESLDRLSFHRYFHYKVFVELVDATGIKLAEQHQLLLDHPENNPALERGERISSSFEFTLPPDVLPGKYRFVVRLYLPNGTHRLPLVSPGGDLVDDHATVGVITVSDPALNRQTIGHLLGADVGLPPAIRLLGYDISPEAVRPGGVLDLALYWQALQSLGRDYTIFVHLTDGAGQLYAQQDGPPLAGRAPTSLWLAGEVLRDPHTLTLKPDLPPGRYQISIGLYDWVTGERLPMFDSNGQRVPEDRIFLPTPIIVEGEAP